MFVRTFVKQGAGLADKPSKKDYRSICKQNMQFFTSENCFNCDFFLFKQISIHGYV